MIFLSLGGGSRIEEQLEYEPNSKKVKTILLLDEHKAWQNSGILSGKEMFLKKQCPIDTCSISYNPKTLDKADLVISRGSVVERPNLRLDFNTLAFTFIRPVKNHKMHIFSQLAEKSALTPGDY